MYNPLRELWFPEGGIHPSQISEPPQLNSFGGEEQLLYSELYLNDKHPLCSFMAEPSHSKAKAHSSQLYSKLHYFGNALYLMTVSQACDI